MHSQRAVAVVRSHDHEVFHWWQLFFIAAIDWWSTIAFWSSGAYQDMKYLAPFAALFLIVNVFAVYHLINRGMKIEPTGRGTVGVILKIFGTTSAVGLILRIWFYSATQLDVALTQSLEVPDAWLHIVENPIFGFFVKPVTLWLEHTLPGLVGYFGSGETTFIWLGSILTFLAIAKLFWNRSGEAAILCMVIICVMVTIFSAAMVAAVIDMTRHPEQLQVYYYNLQSQCPSPWQCVIYVLRESPGQALGLSGVEAMPFLIPLILIPVVVQSEEQKIFARVAGVNKILKVAAIGMCFLMFSSISVAVVVIPHAMVMAGGNAKDRATSWVIHHYLGEWWGSIGDIAFILALAIACSSVMPVLINAMPRILGPLGVHPRWLQRKVAVSVQTLLSCVIATYYKVDVKAMTGSYAVGVMQLLTGLAIADLIDVFRDPNSTRREKISYLFFAVLVTYTSVSVMILKPEGFHNFWYTICLVSLYVVLGLVSRYFDKRTKGIKAPVIVDFDLNGIATNGDVSFVCFKDMPYRSEQIDVEMKHVYIPPGRIGIPLHIYEESERSFTDPLRFEIVQVGDYKVCVASAKSWVVAVPQLGHKVRELGKKAHFNFTQSNGAHVCAMNYDLLYGHEDAKCRPLFHGPVY